MSYSLWASVSLCGILVSYVVGMDFTSIGRCGDCWCLPEDGGTATCPTLTEGITDTFAPSDEIYTTFDLLNPGEEFLKLQSASGEACYPFAAQFVDEEAPYAEANAPECVLPRTGETAVCTYKYASSDSSCAGRRYIIDTFPNEELASNATIVHAGGCGVCSTAQDFGVRIQTYGTLEAEAIKCTISYVFTQDFPALVECFETVGFTTACSTLWAHFGATNSKLCADDCAPTGNEVVLNGPAPDCAPSPCLACQGRFRTVFDQLLGMQFQLAGITERIPVPCSEFYPVVHDPCVGIKTTENEEEEDPTSTATEDDALTSTTTVAAEDDADNGSSSAAGPVVLFRTMLLTSTLFLGMMMLS